MSYHPHVGAQTMADSIRSALIALFQPPHEDHLLNLHDEHQKSWKAFAKDRIRVAAKVTNEVLENMMATGLHKHASPMR